MAHRIGAMGLRRAFTAVWSGVSAEIGRAEVLMLLGVTLVTVGLWPHFGRATLVVPGALALIIALAPMLVPFRKG